MTLTERTERGETRDPASKPGLAVSDVIILCAGEADRDVLAYWCQGLPVRVLVAADGHEARHVIVSAPAPLLITDRALPPWPGLEPLAILRAANPALRIAYLDGGMPDDRIIARVTGAAIVLRKPLSRQDVARLLCADAAGRLP